MREFIFANPLFFILFILIPFIIYYEFKIKKYPAIKFSSINTMKLVKNKKVLSPRVILLILRILSLILLIFSLARPQFVKVSSDILSEGVNIILAIDTSGSMKAIDLQTDKEVVTRLDVVKKVVKEFIQKRKTDPTGLVVFGTEAYTQCPLTLDTNMLKDFVNNIEIGMAGDQTAIGNALALSVNRLKDTKGKSNVVVLLTDGSNTAGRILPDKAVEIAKTFNIKVYTVGVGNPDNEGKVPFLVEGFLGAEVKYAKADLDEKTLKNIAEKTSGKYYRAKSQEELSKIYADIDKLEKNEVKVKNYMEKREVFYYFLIPAILFLLIEIILSNTRFMRIP
ncbi:MAG: VWA domain-containing protein [Candidatus Sericytochromatia bacterium]